MFIYDHLMNLLRVSERRSCSRRPVSSEEGKEGLLRGEKVIEARMEVVLMGGCLNVLLLTRRGSLPLKTPAAQLLISAVQQQRASLWDEQEKIKTLLLLLLLLPVRRQPTSESHPIMKQPGSDVRNNFPELIRHFFCSFFSFYTYSKTGGAELIVGINRTDCLYENSPRFRSVSTVKRPLTNWKKMHIYCLYTNQK